MIADMKKLFLVIAIAIFLSGCTKAQEIAKVEKTVIVQGTKTWDGTILPLYPQGQPEVTLVKFTIPPHTKLEWHKHPVINVGYMLKGSLSVISEHGDELILNEGDPIIELVNTSHYGENRTDAPVEIMVFYAGVKNEPFTTLIQD
jgi:quercetin dioxygenase-like cupin family protein